MRTKKAFTLIELLVVISIIALLIALLLPALNKAKQVASSTQSLSNIRQIAAAAIAYSLEHDGHMPPKVSGTMFAWAGSAGHPAAPAYFNLKPEERPVNAYLLGSTSSDTMKVEIARAPNDEVPFGPPTNASSQFEFYGSSYVANIGGNSEPFTIAGTVVSGLITDEPATTDKFGNPVKLSMKLDHIPKPGRFVILGEEGAWFHAWNIAAPETRYFNGSSPQWNESFGDGHGALIRVERGQLHGDTFDFSWKN